MANSTGKHLANIRYDSLKSIQTDRKIYTVRKSQGRPAFIGGSQPEWASFGLYENILL